MKNERIAYGNDYEIAWEGIQRIIEKYGAKDGHKLVGWVKNLVEVEKIFSGSEEKPTVFVFDPEFPSLNEGQMAVDLIRKLSPSTKIITISRFNGLAMGDDNLVTFIRAQDLIDSLNNLQH